MRYLLKVGLSNNYRNWRIVTLVFDFFSKLFQRKKYLELLQSSEIESISTLIKKGKLEEASKELDVLKSRDDLEIEEKLLINAIESDIQTLNGEYEISFELAKKTLDQSKEINDPLLICTSIISLSNVFLARGDIDKLDDLLEEGLAGVKKIRWRQKKHRLPTEATLNFIQGKYYRKKGELDLALECLQKCIDINNKTRDVYNNADPLNVIGIIYTMKSEFDKATEYLNQSREIFEKIGNITSAIKILNNMGMIYWQKGDLNLALDYYKDCLDRCVKIDNQQYIASLSLNIGLIHFGRGDLDIALNYYLKSKDMFMLQNNKFYLATTLTNIGMVYEYKGELDAALDLYHQSLSIAEILENKQEIATILHNIGNINLDKGDPQSALAYFNKVLVLFEEIGNRLSFCEAIYNIIRVLIDLNLIEDAEESLIKLEEINSQEDNKLINQLTTLAKAFLLKSKERIVSKVEAQQLFKQVSNEEMIKHEYTISAMLNLSELLLLELKLSGNEEVLNEIKSLLDQLLHIVDTTNRVPLLVEIYILQSKMALLELDTVSSMEFLNKGLQIGMNKNIQFLVEKVTYEQENLEEEMVKLRDMVDSSATLYERIQQTKLEDYIVNAQRVVKQIEDVPE